MFIRHCELHHFRSWEQLSLDLHRGITVFVGSNGQGKTNLLEGINLVSTLGSHRVSTTAPLLQQGQQSAQVSTTVVHNNRELTLGVGLASRSSMETTINGSAVPSRNFMGTLTTTLFAPEDLTLVRGEPEQRRRFLDRLLVQRRPLLQPLLRDYDKIIRHRNALLKTARRDPHVLSTLDAWNEQLVQVGSSIIDQRVRLIADLLPRVAEHYATLAPTSRPASLRYVSTVVPPEILEDMGNVVNVGDVGDVCGPQRIEEEFVRRLDEQKERELDRGVTLVGPHRDDMELLLGAQPAKSYASHGESWSFALALSLASYSLMTDEGRAPVLLLDDVFAELDAFRRQALATVAAEAEQTLITAAVGDELPEALAPYTRCIIDSRLIPLTSDTAPSLDTGRGERISFLRTVEYVADSQLRGSEGEAHE